MRRFVLSLFPVFIALVSLGLLVTVRRSEAIRAQIKRIDWRDWIQPAVAEIAEPAEVN